MSSVTHMEARSEAPPLARPHSRTAALCCIQYGSSWKKASDTLERLADMKQFYTALRPYMSGGAYVNYPDVDLPDYAAAYWGANLPRLKQIKSAFDPNNVFSHRQSVPLA